MRNWLFELLTGYGERPQMPVIWWFVSGRKWAFAVIGWLVLAVPFSAHAIWQGKILIADRKGANLAGQMTIENFRETPILWDGFDEPVGLTIELDLVHPAGLEGFVFTPQIRMAPAYDIAADDLQSSRTFSGGYFKDWHIGEDVGDLVLLKPVLFQSIYVNTPPDHDVDALDASGRTHLIYRLHPGTVDLLASQDEICLVNASFGLPNCAPDQDATAGCVGKNTTKVTDVTYHIGADLNALWTATGRTFRNADIGHLIATVMREHSSLQGDSAAWTTHNGGSNRPDSPLPAIASARPAKDRTASEKSVIAGFEPVANEAAARPDRIRSASDR